MHARFRELAQFPVDLTSIALSSAVIMLGMISSSFAQTATDFAPPTGDAAIIAADARLELLFNDACFTEGVTVAPDGQVYFSDITFTSGCRHGESSLPQAGIIWKYDPASSETSVFRSHQRHDQRSEVRCRRQSDRGRGGRLRWPQGHDHRHADRPRPDLAALYDGQPFNSPNDVAVDLRGRIYFTDPRYLGHEPVMQPTMSVYRIDPDGTVSRVISDAGKPNGLLVSPDQSTLYVVSNDNGALDFTRLSETEATQRGPMVIWAYDLAPDGETSNRREFVDFAPYDSAGGLAADANGNVYAAVRRADAPGVYVYNTEGKELASMPTGNLLPSNLAFGRGENANLLYVTAGSALYQIRLNSQGYHLPDS